MESKTCRTCEADKPLSNFCLVKSNKDGYNNFCKLCQQAKDKIYRENNKEKISNRFKEYNLKPEVKAMRSEYAKTFREENLLDMRAKALEKQKRLRATDPFFKFKQNVRNGINKALKRNGLSKKSKTQEMLGCSFDEFRIYIETKFEPWMNWTNRGLYNGTLNYGWDLDHIIPLSCAKTEEDVLKLNHYTNFQPLCSHTNRNIKKDNPILI